MTRTPEQAAEFSRRIRAGLARAKERGVTLGAPLGSSYLADFIRKHGNAPAIKGIQDAAERYYKTIRPVLTEMRQTNPEWNYAEMAAALMEREILTRRGKTEWTATSVQRLCVLFDLNY